MMVSVLMPYGGVCVGSCRVTGADGRQETRICVVAKAYIDEGQYYWSSEPGDGIIRGYCFTCTV